MATTIRIVLLSSFLVASSHALADEELTTRVHDIRDLLVAPDEKVGPVEFYISQALG